MSLSWIQHLYSRVLWMNLCASVQPTHQEVSANVYQFALFHYLHIKLKNNLVIFFFFDVRLTFLLCVHAYIVTKYGLESDWTITHTHAQMWESGLFFWSDFGLQIRLRTFQQLLTHREAVYCNLLDNNNRLISLSKSSQNWNYSYLLL